MLITKGTLISKESSPNGLVSFLRFQVEESFDFKEGQFIMIDRPGVVDQHGKSTKRAYSIGTNTTEMKEKNVVGTIVKKASDFGLSAYLTETMEVGDEIEITGPLGHFFDKGEHARYLFISIGSGLTPLYSMATKLLETGNFDKLSFLFGERHAAHLLPSIHMLFDQANNKTRSGFYLSQEDTMPEGWHAGRIDLGLDDALAFLETNDISVFICGKPEMVDAMREKLQVAGIDESNICFEKY